MTPCFEAMTPRHPICRCSLPTPCRGSHKATPKPLRQQDGNGVPDLPSDRVKSSTKLVVWRECLQESRLARRWRGPESDAQTDHWTS